MCRLHGQWPVVPSARSLFHKALASIYFTTFFFIKCCTLCCIYIVFSFLLHQIIWKKFPSPSLRPMSHLPHHHTTSFLSREIWRPSIKFHDIRYSPCPTYHTSDHTALLHESINFLHARNFDHIFTNILYKTTLNQNFDTAMVQFN